MWNVLCNTVWYSFHMRKKIIQVPMPADLLERVEAAAEKRGESRSAFIREACAQYITQSREDQLQQKYIEGYLRFPESEDEAKALEALAADVLEPEDW